MNVGVFYRQIESERESKKDREGDREVRGEEREIKR